MAQQHQQVRLIARERQITGKQVKQLRREGLLPAVLWDNDRSAQALVLDARAVQMALQGFDPSATLQVTLAIGGHDIPALVRQVERDPLTGQLLHVSFYRVRQDQPVKANVPLVFVGESPAVQRGGILLHPVDTIEIEALPRDLPDSIQVNLSALVEIDQSLTAGDLTMPRGVRLLTDPHTLIAKVQPPKAEVVEEVAPAEAPPPQEQPSPGTSARQPAA
jgi:large subunit ribosomal protein L25